ncbi:MAG: asparaginase [Bellilinea sp.]
MPSFPYTTLVEVTRGPVIESVHVGALAVVDAAGQLIASAGDPYLITYLRSSSKPLQVLPLLEHGGADTFNLNDKEIALMCASHSGTDEHAETVTALQTKIGASESDLLCGVHAPMHQPTADAMLARGEPFTANRHNCSGKHTGFLASAILHKESKEDYINPEHPVQQMIIQTFAEMTGYPREKIAIGVDGCSAPVFAVPLYNAALGFARLCDPKDLPAARAAACRRVTRAMPAHPFMVAGPERFDTIAMQLGGGRFVAKGGAEGYQAIGILPGALGEGSPALGIAFKIADGDLTGRARPMVSIEILRQLGLLSDADIAGPLAHLAARPVTNWRDLKVGELSPAFKLDWSALQQWVSVV